MNFVDIISGWINRHFSNEEAIYLIVLMVIVFVALITLGTYLAPVLTGLVVAFLMQGLVSKLVTWHVPEMVAISIVLLLFLGGLTALMVGLLPLVWSQMNQTVVATPQVIDRLAEGFSELTAEYPEYFSEGSVDVWFTTINTELTELGGAFLQTLVGQVPNVFGIMIFVILVPISAFFFVKDRKRLLGWFQALLPPERKLLDQVGEEMGRQITNYVRGKFAEILIVGAATYLTFAFLGLNNAALLALVVGLSVLIPYVGAAVVTLPVAAVGLLQFGWSLEFLYVIIAYAIIQAIDGNVLVPILFSEAVDLHPIAIIVAVLAFGGIWGLWGVFFAIPLATLIKAIFNAWPTKDPEEAAAEAQEPAL